MDTILITTQEKNHKGKTLHDYSVKYSKSTDGSGVICEVDWKDDNGVKQNQVMTLPIDKKLTDLKIKELVLDRFTTYPVPYEATK